jgi:hypothetical protein
VASQSTLGISPSTIEVGQSATVTLTAKDGSGNPVNIGGQTVTFSLNYTLGNGNGTFSSVVDQGNGTYTSTFTGTQFGSPTTLTATINGASVTTGPYSVTVTNPGLNLVVPIEMIDAPLSSNTLSSRTFARSTVSLDSSNYTFVAGGSTSYSFQVVAENTSSASATISLMDVTGAPSTAATISLSPLTSATITLPPVSFTPMSGPRKFAVQLPNVTTGAVNVYAARILVKQIKADTTQIYVPLTSDHASLNGNAQYDNDAAVTINSISATNQWNRVVTSSVWWKGAGAYQNSSNSITWTFEALLGSASGTVGVALFNLENQVKIPNSEIITAAATSTPILVSSSPMLANDSEFIDSRTYEVRAQGSSVGILAVYRAGIWVKIPQVYRAEVYHRVMTSESPVSPTATSFANQRVSIDPSQFSQPTAFFESIASDSAGGTSTFKPLSCTSSSGTSCSLISGSAITRAFSASLERFRSPSALSLPGGSIMNYIVSLQGGPSNSTTHGASYIVIDTHQ